MGGRDIGKVSSVCPRLCDICGCVQCVELLSERILTINKGLVEDGMDIVTVIRDVRKGDIMKSGGERG